MNKKRRILLYSSNLWYLGEGMLGPLFAVFAQKIGGNILDITWAWATYLIITGLLIMLVGKISDGKKRKEQLVIVGYFLNAILTFGYLFVSSPYQLFFLQAGLGIATALAVPTWSALYSQYEDKRRSCYLWGLASGQANVITGIAIILGGFIVTYFSFNLLFMVMGSVQTLAAFEQLRILRIK